jgi:hypothetical protein
MRPPDLCTLVGSAVCARVLRVHLTCGEVVMGNLPAAVLLGLFELFDALLWANLAPHGRAGRQLGCPKAVDGPVPPKGFRSCARR